MWVKNIIIILIFFVLALFQSSFLNVFDIKGTSPNLVFIAFFTIVFFETLAKNSGYENFFTAVAAGFFLDMFSPFYFGFSIAVLLLLWMMIVAIIHFLKDFQGNSILYFLTIFLLCFFIYKISFSVFSHSLSLNKNVAIEALYHLVLACITFYAYGIFSHIQNQRRQLKLFK